MKHRVYPYQSLAQNTIYVEEVKGKSFDRILFAFRQSGNGSVPLTLTNLAKIKFLMKFAAGFGNEVILDINAAEMCAVTNHEGGYAHDGSGLTVVNALLDLGPWGAYGDASVTLEISTGALGELDQSPKFGVELIQSANPSGLRYCYQGVTIEKDRNFEKVLEILQLTAPSDKYTEVDAERTGNVREHDVMCNALALADGVYEASANTGLVWFDDAGVGQDVKIVPPASTNYVIKRVSKV